MHLSKNNNLRIPLVIQLLNVNSIRAASRWWEIQKLFSVSQADIMILTETNHKDELLINYSAITKLGDNSKTFKDMRRRLINGKKIGLHYTIPTTKKGNGIVFISKPGYKLYPIMEALPLIQQKLTQL